METPRTSAIKRYESIDIARCFAIILVVTGHFRSEYMPHAYDVMVDVIYMFHMPLFMFVSGFLYQATRKVIPYRKFIAGKFRRLMIPYFTVSVLVILLKIFMGGIMTVDNPVTWRAFVEILYYPAAGYFLWFIWALWWMMVIIPLFSTERSRKILLAFSAILFFVSQDLPEIFCIDSFAKMLVFFVGGTVVADYMKKNRIESFSLTGQITSVIVFTVLAWLLVAGAGDNAGMAGKAILTLAANISGIAMSMTLAYWWRIKASGRLLAISYSVAGASYIIYLLHTTFQGFVKSLLFKIHWFDYTPQLLTAWLGAMMIIGAGVVVPWWLATQVLNRWKITAFLFSLKTRCKA
ncbi:MAG: acyltransferase family protein [Paramuribaculum sp.]|nr:acyltransferase family protein [Paramuribaculum sp.]MDE6304941.1 acyltransferase family protein [Paramuribaculum sp.]